MTLEIKIVSPDDFANHLNELALLLKDAVDSNASVGFVNPFSPDEALHWWNHQLSFIRSKEIILFGGFHKGHLVASVQLQLATKSNALHRAEIAKLLVSSSVQRLGFGRQLMLHALTHAKMLGRTLIVLDTQSKSKAEYLYRSLGFQELGVIPDYAAVPTGELIGSLFMWKKL